MILLPFFGADSLQIIPAAWLVSIGFLFTGRWPGGDPPAWAAGEARPWPSPPRDAGRKARAKGKGPPPHGAARAPPAPPTPTAPRASAASAAPGADRSVAAEAPPRLQACAVFD